MINALKVILRSFIVNNIQNLSSILVSIGKHVHSSFKKFLFSPQRFFRNDVGRPTISPESAQFWISSYYARKKIHIGKVHATQLKKKLRMYCTYIKQLKNWQIYYILL